MDLYDELPNSELLYLPEFSLLLESAVQNNVSMMELLTLNSNDLSRVLKRSINEVAKFQQLIFKELDLQYHEKNEPITLAEIDKPKAFTTGDVEIDGLLGGGIFTHGITEIFGESSTGKSQLLMLLSLSIQLPLALGGLGGKSVYITTEGDLPTQRLEEIIFSRSDFVDNSVSQNNIFTVGCNDLITQEHILKVQLPVLLEQNKGDIKLIIIDSISHHMRVELQSNSFKESHANRHYIDELAEHLLQLAKKYSLAIVVTNQVGDKILPTSMDSFNHEIMDYDYQLGWIVGWKDSSIVYRQKLAQAKVNQSPLTEKLILSDDEDYMLVEKEISKVMMKKSTEIKKEALDKEIPVHEQKEKKTGTENTAHKKSKVFKRKIDSHIPNLGLSWANHLSTRILLKKQYKASSLVTRGEAHLYKGNDPAAFWQVKRSIKVIFSTYTNNNELTYAITEKGVESV